MNPAKLGRTLERWREAGLIDEATRARIEAFEGAQHKPIALYALGVLGAATVALGIVSVIAANWDAIPGRVKLGVDLALLAGLAGATFWSLRRGAGLASEVLVSVLYGVTLASLGLVGQVYQLDTPLYQALLVWSLSTLPLVLLGHTRYLGALVCAGLATTHAVGLDGLSDWLRRDLQLSTHTETNLFVTLVYISVLAYVPLSRVPWLVRERPEYAKALGALAWVAVLLGGFGLQFVWYERVADSEILSWALLPIGAATAGLALALPRLYPDLPRAAHRTLSATLGFAFLSLAASASFARGSLDFVGAILQLAWLGLFAAAALQLGAPRLFNALTALLALRVLVIYFEVFGSLLSTGVGLITGGILTLLIAWLWHSKARKLAPRPAAAHGDPHAA